MIFPNLRVPQVTARLPDDGQWPTSRGSYKDINFLSIGFRPSLIWTRVVCCHRRQLWRIMTLAVATN